MYLSLSITNPLDCRDANKSRKSVILGQRALQQWGKLNLMLVEHFGILFDFVAVRAGLGYEYEERRNSNWLAYFWSNSTNWAHSSSGWYEIDVNVWNYQNSWVSKFFCVTHFIFSLTKPEVQKEYKFLVVRRNVPPWYKNKKVISGLGYSNVIAYYWYLKHLC